MSQLFVELYLDEDVDVLMAQLIRARGFVVVTTQEAGQFRNNDAKQLAYAVSQHKTLLTHNRADFEALAQTYFAAGQSHAGIIVAVRRPPREIARRLLRILNHVTADLSSDTCCVEPIRGLSLCLTRTCDVSWATDGKFESPLLTTHQPTAL